MDLKEIGYENMDWIHLVQRWGLVNTLILGLHTASETS
jgi:hypothetical protein